LFAKLSLSLFISIHLAVALSLSFCYLSDRNGSDIDPSTAVWDYQWLHSTFNEFICLHVFLYLAPKLFSLACRFGQIQLAKNYRLFVRVSSEFSRGKVHFMCLYVCVWTQVDKDECKISKRFVG